MQDAVKKHLRMVNVVGVIALLVMLGGSVGLGVAPAFRKGVACIDEAGRLKMQVASLDGLSREIDSVEQARKETEERLNEAERRLPRSNDMDGFMQQVAKVAEQAGLQVDAITPSHEFTDAGSYKSLPVEIIGTGDWEICYRFLTGLRAMNRLTRLDAIAIEEDKDSKILFPDHPQCRITVGISTFMAR